MTQLTTGVMVEIIKTVTEKGGHMATGLDYAEMMVDALKPYLGDPNMVLDLGPDAVLHLSKREYFAARAMQGMLASPHGITINGESVEVNTETVSKAAYLYADAMLEASHE